MLCGLEDNHLILRNQLIQRTGWCRRRSLQIAHSWCGNATTRLKVPIWHFPRMPFVIGNISGQHPLVSFECAAFSANSPTSPTKTQSRECALLRTLDQSPSYAAVLPIVNRLTDDSNAGSAAAGRRSMVPTPSDRLALRQVGPNLPCNWAWLDQAICRLTSSLKTPSVSMSSAKEPH